MEPHIIDFYNDEPQIVHIINKQNEEYAVAMETIRSLEKENKKLRKIQKELDSFSPPDVVESGKDEEGYCILEDKLIDICLEMCGGNEDNDEPLSEKILDDYRDFNPGKPLKDDSIIKRFVDELNKVTGYKDPSWCLTKVISECEVLGYDDKWICRAPHICIYDLSRNLADFCDFNLPTVHNYVYNEA